ncbi:MAG: 6-phosphogluconolactonase [Betaproteobacteria bacterium]|nr:6-phosphogluconolactonase [Betaproteobacteria bacterium]
MTAGNNPSVSFRQRLDARVSRCSSVADLAAAVAERFAVLIQQAIADRGRASIVLSGGRTPESYLSAIAAGALPWQRLDFFLSDERWVDEDSPYSNAALIRRALLARDGPSKAHFTAMKNSAATAASGVAAAVAALPPLEQHYDLALLGMGADGHFASLFPGMADLARWLESDNAERLVAVPAPSTAPPPIPRLSMTAAEIKRSRNIVLVLQGKEKMRVLEQAAIEGDVLALPVRALGEVEVIWCP